MRRDWTALALLLVTLNVLAPSTVLADDPASQVVSLVNSTRLQSGLAPLALSGALSASAQAYAQALAVGGFFSHTGLDGSTLLTRDEAAGYTGWDYLEENLAGGQSSAAQAVAAWMASPQHRTNILSPWVHDTGVGYAVAPGSKYVYYWVEEFGDRPGVVSPVPTPTTWVAPTGHTVSGDWLSFLRSHGDVDILGQPVSDVIVDPAGTGMLVQYFQRQILEWHPENSSENRVQRRLLGDLLYPAVDPPVSPEDTPPGPADYFPISPEGLSGLGHFVGDVSRTGQPIYFKEFFDAHGGVSAFGYPKEEATLRDGRWTQRFQAAIFEYHPEYDRDGVVPGTTIQLRTYRVQLALLGNEYVASHALTLD